MDIKLETREHSTNWWSTPRNGRLSQNYNKNKSMKELPVKNQWPVYNPFYEPPQSSTLTTLPR